MVKKGKMELLNSPYLMAVRCQLHDNKQVVQIIKTSPPTVILTPHRP